MRFSLILFIFSAGIAALYAHDTELDLKLDALTPDELLDGLHKDAHEGNYYSYFARYSSDAIFLGTDKTERWSINQFKEYAKPAFKDGHGWTYVVIERNWEGNGDIRWFDEILHNQKYGHCRGTGVIKQIDNEWKIVHYSLTLLVPNSIAAEVGLLTQQADKNGGKHE